MTYFVAVSACVAGACLYVKKMSHFFRKSIKPVVKQEPVFSVQENKVVIQIVVTSLVEPQVTWSFGKQRLTSGGRYAYKTVKQGDSYCVMLEMDQVCDARPPHMRFRRSATPHFRFC